MFRWFAKRFIKNYEDVSAPGVRVAYGVAASLLAVGANCLLFTTKLITGLAAGSVAIVADGVNNLSDAASNIVSLFGFRMSSRPADEEHPYGHGRYEYLAGLMVAVLILVAGVELLRNGIDRVLSPESSNLTLVMMAALAASILVKLWMMVMNSEAAAAIDSETLRATAADSRNDAIATGVVLLGSLVGRFTHVDLDGWLGIGVAVFVLVSGYKLVRETLDTLLGKRPEPQVIDSIRRKIESCPAVLGTHDLMLHDYGPGRRFASAHVEVAAEGDIMAQSAALKELSRDFLASEGLHIIFQIDPITSRDTMENRLRRNITERVSVIDPRVAIHDLTITEEGGVKVRFDAYVPQDVEISERELRHILENAVREEYPGAECEVTVDRDYMAPPK